MRALSGSLALGALVATVACGDATGVHEAAASSSVSALTKAKVPYIRPKGMALQIPLEQARVDGGVQSLVDRHEASGFNPFFTKGGAPLPVYLERNSVTYTAGANNSAQNRSSIVQSGSRTVTAYQGSDASWEAIKTCLQDQFSRFNVVITDVEPTSGEYVEAKFGGTPQQVDLPNGVGGVAPIDNFSCSIIPRAVVFTFSDVLGNNARLNCEVAAQEIAHAFSLDHEFLCQDPMTYLSGCGQKSFQDIDAQCGEFEPRQCNCNRPSHNSVQIMLDKLGPSGPVTPPDPDDLLPPVVSIVSPADDASLQSNATIQIVADVTDDGSVAATELVWNFSGEVFPCPTSQSGGAVTCTRAGARSTWTLNVGTGDRTFSVRARDGGNNAAASAERTIHLTDGGTPPPPLPDDEVAPAVSVVSPADGAELLANSTIEITAQTSDNEGLAAVELLWTFSGDTFPCPFNGQAVSCTQDGDTFTWRLTVGVGSRAFQVRATDLANNATVSPLRTVTLTTDPGPPVDPPTGDEDLAEPNDDASTAFATRCGNAMDVVATPNDEDWFIIEAPAGTNVAVGLAATEGAALSLALFRADGVTSLDSSDDAIAAPLTVTSQDDAVLARVTTAGALSVSYRVAVSCGTDEVPPVPDSDDEFEPNDDRTGAVRSFCGQERTGLAALDDDYYVVTVREGDTLGVTVTGGGAVATVVDAGGNEVGSPGETTVGEGLAGGDVYVRVWPTGDGAAYGVSFECTEADAAPGPTAASGCGCSASDTNGSAFVLAGLGALLVVRRRRRDV